MTGTGNTAQSLWDDQLSSLADALARFGGDVVRRTPAAISIHHDGGHIGGFFQATIPLTRFHAEDVLEQAREVAHATRTPQFVWAPAGSCLSVHCWQEGLTQASSLAAMVLTLPGTAGQPAPGAPPSGKPLSASPEAFRAVHATQFQDSPNPVAAVNHFGRNEVLLSDDVTVAVAADPDPLGAGFSVTIGDVAGIYYVAVAPAARRRGLARRVMSALISDAGERGCRRLVLQATKLGRPLYASLGFADMGLFEKWTVPPPNHEGQAAGGGAATSG